MTNDPIAEWVAQAMKVRDAYTNLMRTIHKVAWLHGHHLTASQAFILIVVGDERVTATDLILINAYAGTNVSYNIAKLREGGYLHQMVNPDDRRVHWLSLTDLGQRARLSMLAALCPRSAVWPTDDACDEPKRRAIR